MSGLQFFLFFPTLSWWMLASRALVITDQTQKGEGDSATRSGKWKEGMIGCFFGKEIKKIFTQLWGTPKGSKKKLYWVLDKQCIRTGRKEREEENLWPLWKFHPISKIKYLRTTTTKFRLQLYGFFIQEHSRVVFKNLYRLYICLASTVMFLRDKI